jgi:hypothetical protein
VPPVLRAFDLVENIRESAERLRQRELENSVLGLIRADRIEANAIRLGIDGNVAVDPGTLTAGDADTLIDFAPNTMTLGHIASLIHIPDGALEVSNAASLITVPPGALSAGGNPATAQALIPTSGITNTLLAPDSVTTSKISANAVGANEIAANAITAGKIVAGAVTTGKLDVGAVTAGKIDVDTLDAITATYKTNAGVPRLALSPTGVVFWSEEALPGDSPTNNCITYRYSDSGGEKSVGQVRGNHPIISGSQAHQMEMVTFTLGGAFGFITSKMTVRNSFGDELAYVKVAASGTVEGSSSWNNTSDRKLKADIGDLGTALPAIRALRPRSFTRLDDDRRHHGFVAQEVAPVIPEAVYTSYVSRPKQLDDGGLEESLEPVEMLTESHILAHVVRAVQELSDEVDKLKAQK